MKKSLTVTKTDGNGNEYEVPDPDRWNDKGYLVKRRNKMTHLTPPKKKRK